VEERGQTAEEVKEADVERFPFFQRKINKVSRGRKVGEKYWKKK